MLYLKSVVYMPFKKTQEFCIEINPSLLPLESLPLKHGKNHDSRSTYLGEKSSSVCMSYIH